MTGVTIEMGLDELLKWLADPKKDGQAMVKLIHGPLTLQATVRGKLHLYEPSIWIDHTYCDVKGLFREAREAIEQIADVSAPWRGGVSGEGPPLGESPA